MPIRMGPLRKAILNLEKKALGDAAPQVPSAQAIANAPISRRTFLKGAGIGAGAAAAGIAGVKAPGLKRALAPAAVKVLPPDPGRAAMIGHDLLQEGWKKLAKIPTPSGKAFSHRNNAIHAIELITKDKGLNYSRKDLQDLYDDFLQDGKPNSIGRMMDFLVNKHPEHLAKKGTPEYENLLNRRLATENEYRRKRGLPSFDQYVLQERRTNSTGPYKRLTPEDIRSFQKLDELPDGV